MSFDIDAAWIAGLLLAMVRVAAFVAASPILARIVPVTGRIAFVVAVGVFFADRAPATLGTSDLLTAAVVNVFIGLVLGFLTGLIFHLFAMAGSLLDLTSGFSVGAIIDPVTGVSAAVFGRAFSMTALVLFLGVGGDRLMIRGLGATIDAVALDGSVSFDGGLADIGVTLLGRMLIAAFELSLPALAALFAAEVVLGIAARFAPQANVFLVGLPLKIITALSTVWLVVLLLPETFTGTLRVIEESFVDVIGVLGG
jgi:flagellar biosynthetic protein FliR